MSTAQRLALEERPCSVHGIGDAVCESHLRSKWTCVVATGQIRLSVEIFAP